MYTKYRLVLWDRISCRVCQDCGCSKWRACIVWLSVNFVLLAFLFVYGATAPQWARASSFTRFLDHIQRRTTVGRTPLDEWSACRRDLLVLLVALLISRGWTISAPIFLTFLFLLGSWNYFKRLDEIRSILIIKRRDYEIK